MFLAREVNPNDPNWYLPHCLCFGMGILGGKEIWVPWHGWLLLAGWYNKFAIYIFSWTHDLSKSKTHVYEFHCALCHSPLPILHTLFLVFPPFKLGRHTSTLGDLESYANRLALGPTFAAHWQPRGGQEQVGRSIFGPFAAGTRIPPATSRYHGSITDHPTNASEWGRDLSRFTTGICSTPWSCTSHWWGRQGTLGSGVHFEEPCGRWRLDS